VRRRLGERLALEYPTEADVVMGVPDSATAHAIGYAHQSGIPFGEGLIKNRYIGRTFIQPSARLRQRGVALKYNALSESLRGRRIILVDDSIVRGTTSGPIVGLLRQAGAAEIHMRVASPPITCPCFMGVDMAAREELIAANKTVEEIGEQIGADSLRYLSLEGLEEAIERPIEGYCTACFCGEYPLDLDEDLGRDALE
jgi:amidophosphoribosyltransferase